jgi:hypothetical protein
MISSPSAEAESHLEIDLRDPAVAAFLAWLIPGAGHLYQRRTAKGLLFMACILGTYFFGLALGEGKVVYASWNQVEKRWQYPLQLGVGLPALPAIVQSMRARRAAERPNIEEEKANDEKSIWSARGGIMAPPSTQEELSDWHYKLNLRFELGTLYTMVAGLLNVLAIWDAYGGPVVSEPGKPERGPPEGKDKDAKGKKAG